MIKVVTDAYWNLAIFKAPEIIKLRENDDEVTIILDGEFTLEEMQIVVNELIDQKRKKETEW